MTKGFVIIAQNTTSVDYVSCANQLFKSIKRYIPDAEVTILTELPYGDLAPHSDWKLINDWQVYEASPYEYTIKLEADMILTSSIDYWWDILQDRDIVVSSTIRNFKGEISNARAYRKFIDNNNLPDVYNAITYFKKSENAKKFFTIVRDVFENWEEYKVTFQCDIDEPVTTDWAYSIACHIMGTESTTMPSFTQMSMVHMKQFINGLHSEDWTKELVAELQPEVVRINGIVQRYPFHYHIKSFANVLGETYGR
jgi:hypothetical protein